MAAKKRSKAKRKYGVKRDYKKIDLFVKGGYVGTTTWSATPTDARVRLVDAMADKGQDISLSDVKAIRQK